MHILKIAVPMRLRNARILSEYLRVRYNKTLQVSSDYRMKSVAFLYFRSKGTELHFDSLGTHSSRKYERIPKEGIACLLALGFQ